VEYLNLPDKLQISNEVVVLMEIIVYAVVHRVNWNFSPQSQ